VSLVVRARNEAAHIGTLLELVSRQSKPVHEVVVVDSGSDDATVSIAAARGAKIVCIAPSDFSFGRSLNLGIEHTTGDIIAIASAHVRPTSTLWLEHLLAPFADNAVVLTYGRQVGDKRTAFSEHQIFRKWFPSQSDFDQQHPFCNNANAAIRRSVWAELRYDETLTGLEDLHWALRASGQGGRIAYIAEAVVEHLHDETLSMIIRRYEREAIAHRRIIGDQTMTALEAASLAVANIAADVVAAVRVGRINALPSIVKFRSAQFVGTYRGFREVGEVTEVLRRRFFYPDLPTFRRRDP
jgi:glycosyltransferase involved in cell wall biosynthesis